MWNLGNRATVVLISVTCGCLLIYNAWGVILALVLSLLLVVYACYSLLTNDSLVSPQAHYVLAYLRGAIGELHVALDSAIDHNIRQVRKLWHTASRYYRERFPFRMDRRYGRSKSYQLSSDSHSTAAGRPRDSLIPSTSTPTSAGLGLISQLSPIPRDAYSFPRDEDTSAIAYKYYFSDHDRSQVAFSRFTSTALYQSGDKANSRNGDIGVTPTRRTSVAHSQGHMLSRGENIAHFSAEGSPWNTSVSPKMRPRPAGMKTVQTVAGPLLASTRYNIDPKLYTDVSSPGLTTRLTKYATEAKNKLTHQSQYGTGQFPKVNMNANPVPLLSTKLTKMRIPVTVKLAPPDSARYSPPERQRILSNIRHAPNNKPSTSVVQVLREISLKRHASREDVTFDVAKKQKTEDLFDEESDMILEETKQKRSRDDSSKSEEDLSPQNIAVRPAKKRTKTQSCYDILNSLSSSTHVSSGVKRKAVDFSRSGTPDFEKHFKSLKSVQPSNSGSSGANSPQFPTVDANKPEIKEIYWRSPEIINHDKVQDTLVIKGILKPCSKELKSNLNESTLTVQKKTKNTENSGNTEATASNKSVKLTDKLFMKAEPERKGWLKIIAEDQYNVKAKFATNNVEEIKKEDIRNMRLSNMKARLQSMFDAISGKGESKINPDVVIQADDVNAVTPIVSSPSGCATLNSLTTTTNVNTTPISTAAIVPGGILTSKPDTKSAFSSPSAVSPVKSSAPVTSTPEAKGVQSILQTESSILQVKAVTTTVSSSESLQKVVPTTSNATPNFAFGKPITEASPTVTTSPLPNFGINNTSSNTSTILPIAITTAVSKTPVLSTPVNFFGNNKTPQSSTFAPISSSSTSGSKFETSNTIVANTTTISFVTTTSGQATFTFGNNKPSAMSLAMPTQTSTSTLLTQFTDSSLPVNTNATVSVAGFNNTTTSSVAITSSAAKPLFNFGDSNITSQIPKPSDLFGLSQLNSNAQSKSTFGNVSSNQETTRPLESNKSFSFTPSTSTVTAANNSFGANTNTTAAPAFGLSTTSTFSLGTSATSTPSVSKPLFMFGVNSSGSATTTSTPSATTVFGTMNNSAASAFGTPTTIAIPQFGTPTTTASQFGAATTTAAQFGTPTTMPQFGVQTTTASQFGTSTTTASRFGVPTTTVPQFGASTTNVPQFGTPTTTTPQFGTPTNATPQFGAPNTTAPQFGASTTTSMFAATSNTTTASIFGATSNQPIFGSGTSTSSATSMFNAPKNTAASIFTVTTSASTSDSAGSGNLLFTGANATSNNPTSTTSSIFGSGAPIFGQVKPSTSFGSTSTGIFGSTSSTLFGSTQTTNALTLGINKNNNNSTGSTGGTTITPVFDTSNNTTSAFGAPNAGTAAANTSGTNTSAFGSTTNMFGSTADNTSVPLFGANTSQPTTGTFGSSTASASTFGGGQNTTNLTFGNTATGSTGAFGGDSKPLFGAASTNTSGFGGSSIPAFGTDNTGNAGTNTSGMFFGNNQKDGQQNTTFAFTSNFNAGNSSTTASSTPFQFGTTTTKPASTGFNFTAPSATSPINFGVTSAPTFNPSTPGMFSIGSGSTVPRSRTNRTRKPR